MPNPGQPPPQPDRPYVITLQLGFENTGAVDIAKQVHGRCQNAASETLLIDAYVARISALIDRNLLAEGKRLMDLVRRRYPASRERLPSHSHGPRRRA